MKFYGKQQSVEQQSVSAGDGGKVVGAVCRFGGACRSGQFFRLRVDIQHRSEPQQIIRAPSQNGEESGVASRRDAIREESTGVK